MGNIKSTWKSIKSIITIKSVYLPVVLHSQTKMKYQISLMIIFHQLLQK